MTEKSAIKQNNTPHWFPRSCVGIHIVQSLTLGLHSHAGAWERGHELTGNEFDMQGLAELKAFLQVTEGSK